MSDVFISYSRRDIDFVRQIFDQLTTHDYAPWVDWQDIPPTADWLSEIYRGIETANVFLFVISPDSVASEICTLEVEHALKHNKRLIPIVWKEVEEEQIHSSIISYNWIFLRQEDDFNVNFQLLIEALGTDLTYLREHTRLLTRAVEWDENGRRRSGILQGPDLITAEGWISISQSMEPPASQLHQDYITFSCATVKRLQQLIYSGIGFAFICLSGLLVFALIQRQEAASQRLVAEEAAKLAQQQRSEALEAKDEAEKQRQEADQQRKVAINARKDADQQRDKALDAKEKLEFNKKSGKPEKKTNKRRT
jgi:hypothetical protein